jgi:glycolate oxidase iron-sulfur subunit
MLHHIDPRPLGPQGTHMARAITTCVHCGFCLPACPTYQVLGEEMDSPRGRIFLMKSVLEGELAWQDALPYVDRCLGCVACVTACPSGVAYGELLTPFRAQAESHRERSLIDRFKRWIVQETLPDPARFRIAVWLGLLARRVPAMVPGPFRPMLDLLPKRLPPEGEELPETMPAVGVRKARVALLAGCAQQVLAPNIGWAALRVLSRAGVEVMVPPDQECCGALALHVGEEERARELALRNLEAFPDDVDAIVTTAAGCGSGLRDYAQLFEGTPDEDRAKAFAARTIDIAAFLHRLLQQSGLPELSPLPAPAIVAYHDACHLAHAQGVRAEPRALLRRIPNVTLVEVPDAGTCCGSAGTYNLDQPEIARALGQRKAAALLGTRADVIVSGNIGCLTQIQTQIETAMAASNPQRQPQPEVLHTIELIDRALPR